MAWFRRLLQSRALRNAGYWLIGSHGAIAKLISSCIFCKKLLGLLLEQKMADLPQTERRLGLPLPASVSTCLEHGWYSPGSPVVVFFDRGHPRFWNLTWGLHRCLQQQGVRAVFKSETMLRSQLVRPKDAVDPAKQDGVVYRIPCECGKTYARQN